ncbi:hypothetical protein [Nitratifractor sp.]
MNHSLSFFCFSHAVFEHGEAPKTRSFVVRAQSLETATIFSLPQKEETILSQGSFNQTAVPRLFSFSLLRFFFSFVAKTKRKRNERVRKKVSDASVKAGIHDKKEALLSFEAIDPAVKPRNDETHVIPGKLLELNSFTTINLTTKLKPPTTKEAEKMKLQVKRRGANRNFPLFTFHLSSKLGSSLLTLH